MTNNKTIHGSCHCGALTYEADVDVASAAPTQITMCNCRICTKLGVLGLKVAPSAFRVTKGEALAGTYTRFPKVGVRFFCKTCGVYCFGRANIPEAGGELVSVNANTLDDVDPYTLPRMHWDGRHDNWAAGPRPTPWPIGLMAL